MAARSLTASPEGIAKAQSALTSLSLNQMELARSVEFGRDTVNHFFTGKPVDRKYFVKICKKLKLDWEEVAVLPSTINIDAVVEEVRKKVHGSIQQQCGTMRVLDMSQPIGLEDIYTNVNILEKITGKQRKEIAELLQEYNLRDDERFGLGRVSEEQVPGLDAVNRHTKLMVLGKPGAGKTTFLKYVAIQCNEGNFQTESVPIFVTLKDFAEAKNQPSLLDYIHQKLSKDKVTDTQVADLFDNGRALILLDGLDEVREEDNKRVLKEIRDFAEQYDKNRFVVTCRIAAKEYTFEKFTEVEVADFDEKQIQTFAEKWFNAKDPVKAERFITKLEENKPIKELATNPLLLTLLCLVFEESADFPANRSDLYKEGLDVLLKKWDAERNIERDQVYKKLSLKRKEDLLSQIALTTFKRGDYFFKKKEIEGYISKYICNLPDAKDDPEVLHLDSEAVLQSINAQHGLLVERARGIYSFSHLTFQEYFTANKIVSSPASQALEQLQKLASHITEKRWREVFLLTLEMLSSADYLLELIKQQIDKLLAADEKLQQFFSSVNEKSLSVKASYKPAAVRAFYCYLTGAFDFDYNLEFAKALDQNLTRALHRAERWQHKDDPDFIPLALDQQLTEALKRSNPFNLNLALALATEPRLEQELPGLKQKLEELKAQLSDSKNNPKVEQQCWQDDGQNWTQQLRAVIIEHRNIGHDWQFNKQQQDLLKQYYSANQLLVDCLNSDCYVSREVRQEIEETLLLPIAEIEKRRNQSELAPS